MLMETFHKWKKIQRSKGYPYPDDEDLFEIFFHQYSMGVTATELLSELAWEITQLQECVEGLIEDGEY
jgi:hypothetical protein